MAKQDAATVNTKGAENVPTLDFTTADIKGMNLTGSGALVISKTDGSTVTIENFRELSQQGAKLTLADGQTIDTQKLFVTLSATAPQQDVVNAAESVDAAAPQFSNVITIPQPQAGQTTQVTLQPGQTYALGFDPEAGTSTVENGNLVISFADGSKVVLGGFEAAIGDANPPVLTLADGNIISGLDLLAQVEPAAGEEQDMAELAEQLAEVEPAAGDVGGPAGSRGGFGFQSAIDSAPLGSPDPVGPLGPTALQFDLPSFDFAPFAQNELSPEAPGEPSFETNDAFVYEDGTVQLNINFDSNNEPNVNTTATLTGIPSDWTVDPGFGTYDSATGTWTMVLLGGGTFTGGPRLSPPADSDVDLPNLQLTVTNTSTVNGLSSSINGVVNVFVDAVADKPTLVTQDASGNEDAALPVSIRTAVIDTDGSESIASILVSGVPAGFTLSAGTDLGGGDWQFTPSQLAGLTITAPTHYSGSLTLQVQTFNAETTTSGSEFDTTNNTNSNAGNLTLTWSPVADTPDLSVQDVVVKEDGSILLPISATLVDTDGSEFLTVTVQGIPAGWGVANNGGSYNAATGIWTITLAPGLNFSGGPTLTPPADSDVDSPALTVTATATETGNGDSATNTGTALVIVDAVADLPTVDGQNNAGLENTALAVQISGAVTDTDGSETIVKYQVSGVPTGFAFSNGSDLGGGVWEFSPAQLAGLTATSPANFVGTVPLTVTVFTAETNLSGTETDAGDNTSSASDPFTLQWKPEANTPSAEANLGVDDALVKEDGSVFVAIKAALDPAGSGNEVLTVTVTGLNPAWTITNTDGTYNAATGTWTITLPAGQNYNGGLTFAPPANSDLDMTGLNATATAFEPATGTSASANDAFRVVTDAVADAPNLSANSPGGEEDQPIALNIATSVNDLDGSESITGVLISGVPSGASLSAGTNLGGGAWQLTTAQLTGLKLNPPSGFSGTINLTVKSTVEETTLGGAEVDFTDNTASKTVSLAVVVTPDDVPEDFKTPDKIVDETNLAATGTVTVTSTLTANFGSDAPGSFSGNGSFSSANPLTSNGTTVTVTLVGNTYVGTAGTDQIFTLQVNSNGAYAFNLTGVLDHPDATNANDALALNFGVRATDSDGDFVNGTVTITVLDDAPLARNDVNEFDLLDGGTDGNVVTGLNGGVGAADSASQDVANNVTSVTFGSTTVTVPATGTATINGTHGVLTLSADGSYTYTLNGAGTGAGGEKDFATTNLYPAQADGLALNPAANYYGITAGDLTVGSQATGTITFVSEGAGYNNTVGMFLVNPDGTITSADVLIQNGNATTFGNSFNFNAGAGQTVGFFLIADGYDTNNSYAGIDLNSGTLQLVYKQGTAFERPATINDAGADVTMVHTSAGGVVTVLVEPMYFSSEKGGSTSLNEDNSVRVVSGLVDPSDTNTLRIGFEDLPGLGDRDFEDIVFDVTLTESCGCTEDVFTYGYTDRDGDTSTATLTLECVPPVILPPSLLVNNGVDNAIVKEDGSVFVPITATLDPAGPATQVLTVTVTGIAASWNITNADGAYNAATGTWTITLAPGQNYNGGLTFAPSANSDLDLGGLNATARATEPVTGLTASSNDAFGIVTDAVADAPNLSATTGAGEQDLPVALTIATSVNDLDGSEAISKIVISGIPTGASLSAGTNLGGGAWQLTTAQLAGLKLNPPAGFSGTINLSVTSTAKEVNLGGAEFDLTDNTATKTVQLAVTIESDDVPTDFKPGAKTVDETNLAATGTVTVSHTMTANFGGDAPGTFGATGGFSSAIPLTSNDVPVTVTLVGNTYVGTAGTDQIFTLQVNTNGTYTFKLTGVVDHPDTTNTNESLALSFGVKATDSDGDFVTGNVTVNVLDDAPKARNDVNDFDLLAGQTNGNVVSGVNGGAGAADTGSQDVPNKVTAVSFGSTIVTVPATGTATINGAHGVLTMDSSGAYTYVLNNTPSAPQQDYNVVMMLDVSGSMGSKTSASSKISLLVGAVKNLMADFNAYDNGVIKVHLVPFATNAGAGTTFTVTDAAGFQNIINFLNNLTGNGNTNYEAPLQSAINWLNAQGSTSAKTISYFVSDGEPNTYINSSGNAVSGNLSTVLAQLNGSADGSNELATIKSLSDEVIGVGVNIGSGIANIDIIDSDGDALNINDPQDLDAAFAASNPINTPQPSTDQFTYTLTDADGDPALATLTLNAAAPVLLVGKNVDDEPGSTTPYQVGTGTGTITGGVASDILVGDIGGSSLETQTKDYNVVMMLDVSGSMGQKSSANSKISLLIKAVKNLMADFHDYDNGVIKVHLVPFATNAGAGTTFTVTDDAGFQSILNYLGNLNGSGNTNYEAPLQSAINWINAQGTTNAETITYFVSDGQPNTYINASGNAVSGNLATVLNELNGTDGSNEIATIKALSDEVIGVGIDIGSSIANINVIDSDGVALNIDDPQDLDAALAATNPLNRLSGVGGDQITGGNGNDLIYGDSVNTDAVAQAFGLTANPGSGWDVFARLEAGESITDPNWDRDDTLAYIRANAEALAAESTGSNNATRSGGDDTLTGGAGNDTIFGQEGDDVITGGAGNDLLYGGSGEDSFVYAGNDGTDTISGFDVSEGDTLDLSQLLSTAGFDPVNDAINQFVFATDTTAGIVIKVDLSGSGNASGAQTLATLEGVHGLDLNALLASGSLTTV